MSTRKLLIVDDEVCLTELLTYSLEKGGYAVTCAHNGAEGFDLACREMPDLIVSDYEMPIFNGLEMATRLRENATTREIPIILLTARGHRIDSAGLDQTNICELMAKPFSARTLRSKVDAILTALGAPTPH